MKTGLLFVVSGPSGVGKGTVLGEMMKRDGTLSYSVSATTRSRRTGETEGVSYYYKTEEEFDRLIESGDILEWDTYQDHRYGTLVSSLNKSLSEGKNLALDITVPGAVRVKELYAERAVSVFILPPSMEELSKRLTERGREGREEIRRRLEFAVLHEMPAYTDFDYVLVNDCLEETVSDLLAILHTEFRRRSGGNEPAADGENGETARAARLLTSCNPDILEKALHLGSFMEQYKITE